MDVISELERAMVLARLGDTEGAKAIHLKILKHEPGNFDGLTELGRLAWEAEDRSTALVAFCLAVQQHPANKIGHVQLGDLLTDDGAWTPDDGALALARHHYATALLIDPECPEAHQGMARVLTELGHPDNEHWIKGFVGHATQKRRYLGSGVGIPLILLACARGGNIPARGWIDERIFDVTVIYADFFDSADASPPHRIVVNAIGDSDFAHDALVCAEKLVQTTTAPVVNQPSSVRLTGREANALRLAKLPGVVTPWIVQKHLSDLMADANLTFPLLLRSPGFHGGKNFVRVADRSLLHFAASELAEGDVLAIEYLDARGADGFWRKYRVMAIDGDLYPLHLAISADWKVHYFSSSMAENPGRRAEEEKFLQDMPGVLGPIAMAALAEIAATLALDYCGIDFALAPDGGVLVFEANATMAIVPADPDPIWDYRRAKLDQAIAAARSMVLKRVGLADEAGAR